LPQGVAAADGVGRSGLRPEQRESCSEGMGLASEHRIPSVEKIAGDAGAAAGMAAERDSEEEAARQSAARASGAESAAGAVPNGAASLAAEAAGEWRLLESGSMQLPAWAAEQPSLLWLWVRAGVWLARPPNSKP
jgi:hypothetical protein